MGMGRRLNRRSELPSCIAMKMQFRGTWWAEPTLRELEDFCGAGPVILAEAESPLDLDVALQPVGLAEHLGDAADAEPQWGHGDDRPIAAVDHLRHYRRIGQDDVVRRRPRGEVEGGGVAVEVFVFLGHQRE